MNLNNILWVYNTMEIIPDAPIGDNLFGMKLGGEGVITTATGNPVSIITNKAQNAISTILSYSPKQSGSGDPSPTNVRPIDGWTEANLGVNSETPTTTISLGGTYYGFTVDVERGVLRVTHAIYTIIESTGLGTFTQSAQYGSWAQVANITGQKTGNDKVLCISDMAVGVSYDDRIVSPNKQRVYSDGLTNKIVIRASASDNITTENDLRTLFMGANIVYELATPIELPLTPQTVALLAGNNTLWCDGDSVTITYRR